VIYQYKCPKGHITEHDFPIGKNPETISCLETVIVEVGIIVGVNIETDCGEIAKRYISNVPPVKYNGTGFASTDLPRKSGLEDIRI